MKYEVTIGEEQYTIEIGQEDQVLVNGEPVDVDFGVIGTPGLYSLLVNNESFEALVERMDDAWKVLMRGHMYDVHVLDERTQLLKARAQLMAPTSGDIIIKAPMPGLVISIEVEVGQEVEAGQTVLILESMKMENEMKSPRAGRIARIGAAAGDSVELNQVLIVIS